MSLLQGVDGKDGDPGPAGEKGDKVRLMNISLQHRIHNYKIYIYRYCFHAVTHPVQFKNQSFPLYVNVQHTNQELALCLCDLYQYQIFL